MKWRAIASVLSCVCAMGMVTSHAQVGKDVKGKDVEEGSEAEIARSPAEIIANAYPDYWRDIDPQQLMVIELEHGRVLIELSDAFAPNHVKQMKTLVKAGFYDGLSFYRVIDGFVAQGGDVFEKRALPDGAIKELKAEFETVIRDFFKSLDTEEDIKIHYLFDDRQVMNMLQAPGDQKEIFASDIDLKGHFLSYDIDYLKGGPEEIALAGNYRGFPMAVKLVTEYGADTLQGAVWPLHCTGAVAMARDTLKDTGGTEFYVALQPQRYLDRNLTIFGRVIDGMQHLQALKRQPAPTEETQSLGDNMVRVWMGDNPPQGKAAPQWQVMKTDTSIFAEYVDARRNRPEGFFHYKANHVDVCQLPIPVRERVE